ncbi:MAG: hypothetical protein H6807_14800 [Planctomycetes bacterium]|nr:hypothetical protein [Planctomycetota bacterium]
MRPVLIAILFVLVAAGAPIASAQPDSVDRWLERAERFAAKGLWRRAANYYAKAAEVEADDEEIARPLALCLMGSGGYEDLDLLGARWLEKKPGDRHWLLVRHDLLRELARDDEALDLLRAALGDGQDFELESLIGRIHQDQGRDDEARKCFETLVDRSKNVVLKSAADLTGLARAQSFWRHDPNKVEESLRSALKAEPEYLPARLELIRLFGGLKENPSVMLKEIRLAEELRPRWPALLEETIAARDLQLGMGDEEKRAAVDLLLAINPRHPGGLYHRGMRRLSDARWDESRQCFDEGLAIAPRDKRLLAGRAALEFVINRVDEHERDMKSVFAIDPGWGYAWAIVAEGLNERRRWDESLAMMEKAVAIDAEDYRLWDLLARYAFYIGNEARGREALEKADALTRYGRVWRNNMVTLMGLLEKSYVTRRSDHFLYKLHAEDAAVLERVVPPFLERSHAEFVERYGIEVRTPIIFDVFRRHEDFSVRTMGTTGLGALGVCFGPSVYMYIPRGGQQAVNWASTAHHELAHVFTLQRSKGRVPRWLTEGLSSWEEVRRNPSWGRNMEIVLHDALHSGEILGLLEFDGAFYGPRIGYAYFQGGLAAQFIEETWGLEAIRAMLSLYAEDKLTEEVVPAALGVSPREFDQRFLDWVRTMLAPLKRIPTYSEAAIKRFEAEVAEGKDVERNRIKAAWGHFRAGRPFDADAQLKPLVEAGCRDPEFRLLLAARARLAKQDDEARKIYAELEAEGFEDLSMSLFLAGTLDREGKGDEALRYWRLAERQNPFDIDPQGPRMVLAERAQAVGDSATWAAKLADLCGLVDTAVEIRAQLVDYWLKEGDQAQALRYIDEILLVQPFSPARQAKRATILVALGRKDEAVAALDTALAIEPSGADEFDLRLALGRLLVDLDRKDEAVYHLVRATELKPGNAEAKALLKAAEQ